MKMRGYPACLLLLLATGLAADPRASATMGFLRIEPDARAMGMAGAVSTVADDVFAAYWNPSALSKMDGFNLGVSHVFWFSDLNYSVLSGSYTIPGFGAVGLYGSALYGGKAGEALDVNADPLNAKVDIGCYSVNLSYAFEPYLIKMGVVGAKMYLGGTAKFIYEKLYSWSKSAVAFDLAFLGESVFLEDINFCLVIRNLGPAVKLKNAQAAESLPFEYTVGFSYSHEYMTRRRDSVVLTPAFDISAPIDYPTVYHAGAEVAWKSVKQDLAFALRFGYVWPQDSISQNGIRAGAGLQYHKLSLDYAFAFHDPLDNVHRLTLKYAFK